MSAENENIVPPQAPETAQATEMVPPATEQAPIVDTPVEVATLAEVAPVAAPVEQPTQTAPPPAVSKEVTPPVVQKNWKDLLKEDGFDERVTAMLDYYKQNNGDLKPYLQAISVDYKAMSPEEIMRRDLQELYPDVDSETLDYIYSEQVTRKYNLDPDLSTSEQATKAGRAMLARDAEKLRQKFIEKQEQFLIPDKDFAAEQQARQEEQARLVQEQQEQFRQSILTSQAAQSLNQTKALSIDLGDGSHFNYAIEPAAVMDLLLVPEKFQALTTKKDASGNVVPDMEALIEVAAFLSDRKAYNKSLITHGKSLGKKEGFDALENIETGSSVAPIVPIESLEQAFRTRATRNY